MTRTRSTTTVRTLSRTRIDMTGDKQIPLHLPHPERICKLDANECLCRPAKTVIDALHFWTDRGMMNWYPDRDAVRLRTALAEYTGQPFSCIRAFNGADDALTYLVDCLVSADSEILVSPPTYNVVPRRAEYHRGKVKKLLLPDIFHKNVDAVLGAIGPDTRLVYLANPNNPTGVLYSRDDITAILRRRPSAVVVIDEAYYEYSGATVADLVRVFPRLFVVRSFSSAFGLAGLRLGYLLAHEHTLESLSRILPPPAVATPAQIAGTAALKAPDDLKLNVSTIGANMTRLAEALCAMGLTAVPTQANFLLVKVAQPSATTEYLAGKLIFVRNCDTLPGLEGYLQITVGDDCTTARILSSFLCMPKQLLGPQITVRRLTLKRPTEYAADGRSTPVDYRNRLAVQVVEA